MISKIVRWTLAATLGSTALTPARPAQAPIKTRTADFDTRKVDMVATLNIVQQRTSATLATIGTTSQEIESE